MHSHRIFLWSLLALVIAIEGVTLILRNNDIDTGIAATATTSAQTADVSLASAAASSALSSSTSKTISTTSVSATATTTSITKATLPQKTTVVPAKKTALPQKTASAGSVAERIANPYTFAPQTFPVTDSDTRAALVNIFCSSMGGAMSSISGSGVMIDPRGVILTNAHVAQYVLLSEAKGINLSCTVRIGSPAKSAWKADVLYIPQVWVNAHVQELNTEGAATGTGEHDYALLVIGSSADQTSLPSSFAYLPIDTREAIGFLGDQVIVASYPAEFLGVAAENSLYSLSSPTTIQQLLTFGSGSVDLLSFDGVIEAQGGSSGGAVVNPWGRLIGMLTTTSNAATTDKRELHAIALSYIDRDMQAQTGSTLAQYLNGNLLDKVESFNSTQAPAIMKQYFARIQGAQ